MDGPTWKEVLDLFNQHETNNIARHDRVRHTLETGLRGVTVRLDAINGRVGKSEQQIDDINRENVEEKARVERIWRRAAMFYGGMIGLITLLGNLVQWWTMIRGFQP